MRLFKKFLKLFGYEFYFILNKKSKSMTIKIIKDMFNQSNEENETEFKKIKIAEAETNFEKINPFNNSKLTLKDSGLGYYYLSPKISKDKLDAYYKNNYWSEFRNVQFIGVNKRDLFHFELIKHFQLSNSVNSVLNFGSGHGGVSFIFSNMNKTVCNVELDNSLNHFKNNIKIYEQLSDVNNNSIDLIYSSHSLEHVFDLGETMEEFKRVKSEDAVFFFEVPNAKWENNGVQKNKVDEPHTYYFFKEYFEDLFSEVILLRSHDGLENLDDFLKSSEEKYNKKVLIAIGRV